jgi:hypothetical protein
MTLRRGYAPMLPEFDEFLFASVGEEVDGIPLSVLSALSRLDLDPRAEAVRLAHLTKEAASEQLARMIARLYDRHWSVSEVRGIASGLVERLPTPGAAATNNHAAEGVNPATGFRAPASLIYLAMAVAVLVVFVASGFLSSGG